jgi:O-antigen ligase
VVGLVCLGVLVLALVAPSDVGVLLAGAAAAAFVAYLVLDEPLLALLLVLVASFIRLAQKEVLSTDVLTPALGLLAASSALAVARGLKTPPRFGAIEWLMAVYLALNILSWLLPHEYDAVEFLTGAPTLPYRWIFTGVLLPFVLYVTAKSVIEDERSARWVLWVVTAMSAYSSWVSIMQFHGPRALVWPRYIVDAPNWEDRAVGIFNQPVVNGVLLVIGFTVCLFLASRPGTRRSVQILLYVLAAANAYSVYLTHTRASLLALVIVLALGVAFASGWRRGFVVVSLVGVAGVAANASTFFSSDRSAGGVGSSHEVYDRLNIMATAWRAIQEHPFVGVGLTRFQIYNTDNHVAWSQDVPWRAGYAILSHENELGIGAELGIPGMLAWIAVVVAILWMLARAVRDLPRDTFMGSPFAFLGLSAMIVMVVNGFTVDLRILDFAMALPFAFAGMVVGEYERRAARRAALDTRVGTVGGGLPTGMSLTDQQRWHERNTSRDDEASGPRPYGRVHEPAR